MAPQRFKTFEEFWRYYLSQHSKPWTQRLHAVGLVAAIASLPLAFWAWGVVGLFVPFIVGYFFAWVAHFFIEHNRPATWGYPLWSFLCEFRLAYRVLIHGRGESG